MFRVINLVAPLLRETCTREWMKSNLLDKTTDR